MQFLSRVVLLSVLFLIVGGCSSNNNKITSYNTHKIGDFVINYAGGDVGGPLLVIKNNKFPNKIIWQSQPGESFISARKVKTVFSRFRIHFYLEEDVLEEYKNITIDSFQKKGDEVVIDGYFSEDNKISFKLIFSLSKFTDQLNFDLKIISDEKLPDDVKLRASLNYASSEDEHFYGLGEQFTYFDQKGKKVPLLVNEQGHGRGKEPITTYQKFFSHGSGGEWYSTYIPVAQYVTNTGRSLYLHNYDYTIFDFEDNDAVSLEVNSPEMSGTIIAADSALECIEKYTEYSGRMRKLPDWIGEGAVVCLQGGSEMVRNLYKRLKDHGVPISAVWLHDWQGRRVMGPNNTRLWWNWVADRNDYPDFEKLVKEFQNDGVRTLGYINPFLTDVSNKENYNGRNLYKEAIKGGYFLKDSSGKAIIMDNGGFDAGLIDLSNPAAWNWIKEVIKTEMLEKNISGWMCDFAEAVPYDSKPYSGESANTYHNKYPEEWARVNREAIDEAGLGDDVVFFSRSGNKKSPSYSTLIWAGDQLVTWDSYDGIKTAVTSLLGSGFSGFALNHSDTGGLVAITQSFINWRRTPEILARWMEMNAFTPVLRTHEGGNPKRVGHQVYDSEDTMKLFARSAKIYAALAPYRKVLMQEMEEKGYPLVRHPLLHYPEDENVLKLEYQFMLGRDFMIVPVLDEGEDEVDVYLPEGNWIHLWSGKEYNVLDKGLKFEISAPIGEPAVFYLKDSKYAREFDRELVSLGIKSKENCPLSK